MGRAQLPERHLTLVFHMCGAKQEGINREEMAGRGKKKRGFGPFGSDVSCKETKTSRATPDMEDMSIAPVYIPLLTVILVL